MRCVRRCLYLGPSALHAGCTGSHPPAECEVISPHPGPDWVLLKNKNNPPHNFTTFISAFQTIKAMHILYKVYTVKNVSPLQYAAPTEAPLPGRWSQLSLMCSLPDRFLCSWTSLCVHSVHVVLKI